MGYQRLSQDKFGLKMDSNNATSYFCAKIATNSLMIMSNPYSDK